MTKNSERNQQRPETEARWFALKDCALIAIATGEKALTLREMRDILVRITPDSLYYHFWGGLLQPRFEEREYNNDFASWAGRSLDDRILAERLAVLDPTSFIDLEELRFTLVDLMDQRLDENETLRWRIATIQFEFICSQIVVFNTDKQVQSPEELAGLLPTLSTSSIFYHFVDARRRVKEGTDDFRVWLGGLPGDYSDLYWQLAAIDPYFGSLSELRKKLADIFNNYYRDGN